MIDAGHGCHNRARRVFGVAHIRQTRTPGRAVAHPMQKPKTPLHTWVDSSAKPSGRAIVHPIQNRKNTSLCLSGHLGQVTRSSDCTPQEKPKKTPLYDCTCTCTWVAPRPSHPVESRGGKWSPPQPYLRQPPRRDAFPVGCGRAGRDRGKSRALPVRAAFLSIADPPGPGWPKMQNIRYRFFTFSSYLAIDFMGIAGYNRLSTQQKRVLTTSSFMYQTQEDLFYETQTVG